ncbi:hypothetical protein PanWU01x14_170070 [Parasponia andersonii]|uniref:Uncharacterized protein n=1 Tax=Parasponia andersonii TaxID=3476 RepID=A0A2P5CA57_PARAD|nr:hypothetical protein PanWU01x14_170070 [Parasponia andersonii]
MGGKRDMAFIKANPYKNVPFDQWNILCDRFSFQEFEGLSSMISQMKAKAEIVTSRAEALTQTQSRAESKLRNGASSTSSMVGLEQVDKFHIVSKDLGTRSRWQKGLGALPQLKSIGGQRAASTRQVAKTIATLKQQLAEKDTEHAWRIDETQR